METLLEFLYAHLVNLGIQWAEHFLNLFPPATGLVDVIRELTLSSAFAWATWYLQVLNGLVPVGPLVGALFYRYTSDYVVVGVRLSSWLYNKIRSLLP